MKIKLTIDGEEKEFVTGKLKGSAYLKIVKAIKKIRKMRDFDEREFLFLADLISYCFHKQFTKEQFINSVDLEDILPTYNKLVEECEKQLLHQSVIKV